MRLKNWKTAWTLWRKESRISFGGLTITAVVTNHVVINAWYHSCWIDLKQTSSQPNIWIRAQCLNVPVSQISFEVCLQLTKRLNMCVPHDVSELQWSLLFLFCSFLWKRLHSLCPLKDFFQNILGNRASIKLCMNADLILNWNKENKRKISVKVSLCETNFVEPPLIRLTETTFKCTSDQKC